MHFVCNILSVGGVKHVPLRHAASGVAGTARVLGRGEQPAAATTNVPPTGLRPGGRSVAAPKPGQILQHLYACRLWLSECRRIFCCTNYQLRGHRHQSKWILSPSPKHILKHMILSVKDIQGICRKGKKEDWQHHADYICWRHYVIAQYVGVLRLMAIRDNAKFLCRMTAEVTKPKAEPFKLPELKDPSVKPPKPQVHLLPYSQTAFSLSRHGDPAEMAA